MTLFNNNEGSQYEMLLKLQALADEKIKVVGEDGKSAYELAVESGFKGSERDWLYSLNGKDKTSHDTQQVVFTVSKGDEDKPYSLEDHFIPVEPISREGYTSLGISLVSSYINTEPVVPHQILVSGAVFHVRRKDNKNTDYELYHLETGAINSEYIKVQLDDIPGIKCVTSFDSTLSKYGVANVISDASFTSSSAVFNDGSTQYSVIGEYNGALTSDVTTSNAISSSNSLVPEKLETFKNALKENNSLNTPIEVAMSIMAFGSTDAVTPNGEKKTVYYPTHFIQVTFVDSMLQVHGYEEA